MCPQDCISNKDFFLTNMRFLKPVRIQRVFFLYFWLTHFGSVVKSTINLFRWSFWGKKLYFFEFFFQFYRILDKKSNFYGSKFIRIRQKCRVRVHGINLRRNIFGTCMFFFRFFSIFGYIILRLPTKYSRNCVQSAFYVSGRIFEQKKRFTKKNDFL